MSVNADRCGPGITVKDDPRITPIGHFLRQSKLDELPQLINVLQGDMSLVGPRPEDPRYVAMYRPAQCQVLTTKPGITSPASLYFRHEDMFLAGKDWETVYREQILPQKLAKDIAYLQRRTVWTDIGVILQTLAVLLNLRKYMDLILHLRNRHLLVLDVAAFLIIPAIALGMRLDSFSWGAALSWSLLLYTGLSLGVKLVVFFSLGLYSCYWRYAGITELTKLLAAVGLSTVILAGLVIMAHGGLAQYNLSMYRSVPLIDGLLTALTMGGFRFGLRGLNHLYARHLAILGGQRVLIAGADDTGAMVVREMRANPQLDMEPVAFVDDDPAKVGTQIEGLAVIGGCDQIPALVSGFNVQQVVMAMPATSVSRQRTIAALCRQTGAKTHTLPGIYELLAGYKTISQVPRINVNQLLHREPVSINQTDVVANLHGARVLVTGAGGSIGSELCRQIAAFKPATLILLGRGENNITEIALDLRLSFPQQGIQPIIANVRDDARVDQIIETYQPQIIFHAAAHKHVPLMEECVAEAITNNVMGTRNVLWAAARHNVERFVLISTDKAVNPTSVMGATKRLAELLVIATARRSGRAFVAVRFGNVLGSRGSVIPIFQRQIAAGGPVTITHPEMTRYFMTIPEAVQLVLQAATLGHGGEIFVLDMGQPVRIVDMAADLIKMSGFKPERDIQFVYTGVRPGEKLFEELFLADEDYQRTRYSKIFIARSEQQIDPNALDQQIAELIELAQTRGALTGNEQLKQVLPRFCHYLNHLPSTAQSPLSTLRLNLSAAASATASLPESANFKL